MSTTARITMMTLSLATIAVLGDCHAQDWPQWRGPNRDGRATGFDAPTTWPDQLQQKWSVEVGGGVATPSLVGDRLYVFSRQDGNEVIRCLNADTGDEVWKDSYAEEGVDGAASRFPNLGPRSSPSVASGKVVTFGVRGKVSCYDAASGELAWRKNDFEGKWPRFFTSSAPIIVGDRVVLFVGSERDGAVVAYALNSGEEQWKLTGKGPTYGSPVAMSVDGTDVIVTPGDEVLIALDAASGALMWEIPYSQGRYNSATPIVDGQTLIIAGPGTGITALNMTKEGEKLVAEEKWRNTDNSVAFNTPALHDRLLYGIAGNGQLFCLNADTGETAWTAAMTEQTALLVPRPTVFAQRQPGQQRGQGQRGGGRGGRGGRRGGMGGGGYGSVVDAGQVLMALTPESQLVVFKPSSEGLEQLASYKVGESGTYAYPVLAGNRIYVKDQSHITLWTLN